MSGDIANQIRAANPRASAFVSANAGAGKTTTLVNRVARLLLAGAEPQALLCVTYTKAAAAEMQRRLFDRLGKWSVMADAPLRAELAALEAGEPEQFDHQHLSEARALFARALETPGGLKIQTIHAFCEKLLKRFPLEAGVSPGFEVVDDAGAAELAAEARDAVARRTLDEPESQLAQAYERFSVALAFDDFEQMFRTFETRRGDLADWISGPDVGGAAGLEAAIARSLGLERIDDPDKVATAGLLALIDMGLWKRAAAALVEATAEGDHLRGQKMYALIEDIEDGRPALSDVLEIFFTAGGEGTPGTWAAKSAALKPWPDLKAALQDLQARLAELRDRVRATRVGRDTWRAMTLAAAYVAEYEDAKTRRRKLDFADLIALTHALLTRRADAAWVLYKLDEGIDHVLVDEAQDTAPEQWAVIGALTEEFFAGAGNEAGRRLARTVFVVGDEKQSIFSFQGAAPERLQAEKVRYQRLAASAGAVLEDIPLRESWRSTPEVLGFVDAVFEPAETRAGLLPRLDGAEPGLIEHIARRLDDPGCVDLWPLEREEPAEEQTAWDEPVDAQGPGAWRRLAERIAAEIQTLLARGEMVHDRDMRTWRPADPGDVLILVRKRSTLFEEVIRALKRRGVPVAGADRLNLSAHPVFGDGLALMRFLRFPHDDLTLAGLLRSPFCDVDEDSLFHLAWKRPGSLWATLLARADERPEWASAAALLQALLAEAATRTPFDLFSRLYARLDAEGRSQRTRLLTRLGAEAADALDEFMAQILAAEQRGERDLERLAHALSRLDVTVKREMDEPKGEVRVMTAHGAKGLEAPIVFLPETVLGGEPRGSPLLETEDGGFLWCGAAKDDCEASKAAKALRKRKGDDEGLRLLYVALTRARDRVVLAGRAKQPRKDGTDNLKGWYPLVAAAFDQPSVAARVRLVTRNGMEIRRFGHDPAVGTGVRAAAPAGPALPAWARRVAPAEPRAARWASPTDLAEQARVPSPSPLAESGGLGRFRRGELIHRLFQLLPDLPPAERPAAAASLLRREPGLADAQREEMIGSVFAVLEDARFAEVFGPGSRPEVAVAGGAPDLPAGLAISGRLDRLVVTPQRVLVVDYKTNRPAPDRAEDADPSYLAQMAVYAAVLRALYPDRPVEAALLWTDGPKLTPLDEALLERTLAGLRG